MVKCKKRIVYHLIYLLIKLALILPVVTVRCFSVMNFVKNRMNNRMRDEWLNNCFVIFIKKDIFNNVDNEKII